MATKLNRFYQTITSSPILWGILGAAAFYGLVHGGPLATPFILRYFTGHPVEYAETMFFAVGLAALVFKALDVAGQYPAMRTSLLGPVLRTGQSAEEVCRTLLERLDRLPARRHAHYYVRRLRTALERVARLGSAEGLDDELKYLADLDAGRLHAGYGLFRVIIWAIPILGFLGTVVGITMALNSLDPKALDESMVRVTTGLGVKFDTTALALAMSMLLMFFHFFVDRAENSLLEKVNRRVEGDLAGRFPLLPAGADRQLTAVRRMAESLVEQLQRGLAEALTAGVKAHAQQLAAAEQAAAEQNRRQWEHLQQGHVQHAQALAAFQAAVVRQGEVLGRAVEAAGEVSRLEDALNRNLAALSGAKHFEQTVLGLAAAIHLLNARLADGTARPASIELEPRRRTAQAA